MAPEELRKHLFDAAQGGDRAALVALCREHQADIERHVADWTKVPDELREDRRALSWYARGLVAVADVFAKELGRPDLLDRLAGAPATNPLGAWRTTLEDAQVLMEELEFDEAASLLVDLLIDLRDFAGNAVDDVLAVTWGRLGECRFQAGRTDDAIGATEKALRLCEEQRDGDGVRAYRGNLYEIHRWKGDGARAAVEAERIAALVPENERRWRRLAELARAGEPLVRVVLEWNGEPYEVLEAPAPLEGTARFVFARNRIALRRSVVRTEEGEKLAGEGRFDEALASFDEAGTVDPYDPHPHYQAGLTLLHLERPADAEASYARADERAPGWYHARAYRWLADEIATGRLEHGTFLAIRLLEDAALEPEKKVTLARQALEGAAEVAWLHLLHGRFLNRLGKSDEALAALRRAIVAERQEQDVRTRALLELAFVSPDESETRECLVEAAELGGNLVAAAMATVALRQRGG